MMRPWNQTWVLWITGRRKASVLRRGRGKVKKKSCGSAGFWFWVLTLTLGSGTCAQGGRVHRAGAAQDIHPLAPLLQKNPVLVSKKQKRVKGRFLPLPPHPPGLPLLQGGALGLHGVVDDAAGPPGEIHGDQGVLRHAPLWRVRGRGRETGVRGQTSQTESLGRDRSRLHTGAERGLTCLPAPRGAQLDCLCGLEKLKMATVARLWPFL